MSPRQLTALLAIVNEQERHEAARQLMIAGVGARGKDGVLEKYINEWSG